MNVLPGIERFAQTIFEHHGWAATSCNHYVKLVTTNINVFRVVCGRGRISKKHYEQRNEDDALKVTWWETFIVTAFTGVIRLGRQSAE